MQEVFTPIGLLLAFGASLAWVGMDAVRKALVVKVDALAMSAALALGQIPIFAVWAALSTWKLESAYAWPGFWSALLGGSGMLLFILAVERAPLGAVVPCLSLTPVLSSLAAWVLVGEEPSAWQLVGGALVVVGSLAQVLWGVPAGSGSAPRLGVFLMLLSAVLWSASAAADKWSLTYASPATHGVVQGIAVCLLSLFAMALMGRLGRLQSVPRNLKGLSLAVVLFVVALGLQWLAFAQVWVGVVEAVKRATGAAGSILLGRLMFNEPFLPARIAAASIMTAGAALVVLG